MPPKRRGRPKNARMHTISQALGDIELEPAALVECQTRDDEFKIIKRKYFKLALEHHPDKGGDAALFRKIHTSFELLRDLHTGTKKSSGHSSAWMFSDDWREDDNNNNGTAPAPEMEEFDMSQYDMDFSNHEVPPWEYYEEAAEEEMPLYRVELAKSGRSKCTAQGKAKNCLEDLPSDNVEKADCQALVDSNNAPELIVKDEIRVGSLDDNSGKYGRWKHLRCFRVPYKVWLGLPDPTKCQDNEQFAAALATMEACLLSGFAELPHADQREFVEHCKNKNNWARKTVSKKKSTPTDSTEKKENIEANDRKMPPVDNSAALVPSSGSSMVAVKQRFVIPRPGINGASDETVFQKKTFVLTGVFPEIGGGVGLDMGKSRVKAMIESFGGVVRTAVSGKTDVLVIGKEPGMAKVTKARGYPKLRLGYLSELQQGLLAGLLSLEDFPLHKSSEPLKIAGGFSSGYFLGQEKGFNGLALKATEKELAIANGFVPHPDAKKEGPKEDEGKEAEGKETEEGQDGDMIVPALLPSNPAAKEPMAKKKRGPMPTEDTADTKKLPAKKKRKKAARKQEDNVAGTSKGEDGAMKAPVNKKRTSKRAASAAAAAKLKETEAGEDEDMD